MNGLRLLAIARVVVGALFVVRTTALANFLPIPLAHVDGALLGWPLAPGARFAELGLGLPGALVLAACVIRTLAAVFFLLGVRARAAGLVAAASAFVVQAQEPFLFFYTLETLYVAIAVLAVADSATCAALRPEPARSPDTSLDLVRGYVAAIYLWAAFAKLHTDWLDGHVLAELLRGGFVTGALARRALASPLVLHASAIAVPAVEALLGVSLLWRKTRRVAVIGAIFFHAGLEEAVHPDVIGYVMCALLIPCWAVGRAPLLSRSPATT